MNLEEILRHEDTTIIDVRTPMEFMGGHVAGSLNIPLAELPYRIEEIKALPAPIVFCCASGNRSGQAAQYCTSLGKEAINGGSWTTVNYYKSLTLQM